MRNYPDDIESHLGFDEIRTLLKGFCQSNKGVARVGSLKPTNRFDSLQKWHTQTREMVVLATSEREKIDLHFLDIDEYLAKVKLPGSFLDAVDFHQLKLSLGTLLSWTDFLYKNEESYPELFKLLIGDPVEPILLTEIDRIIDDRGEVKDSASPELQEIRNKILKSEQAVRSAIQKVLQKAKKEQFTDDDSKLTVREGRLVIPIKAEHKKRIPGFIHDESATGQTVFMEPGEVLELNNQVRELKYAEKREVVRILTALSDLVRKNLSALKAGSELLEKLDFIHAKCKLADLLDARVPVFSKSPSIRWVNAVHPLLLLSHKASKKKVVPLVISLIPDQRILIISGPNAGGKSVALKTVGLLQYMFQCGLPVSVGEETEFGLFDQFFLDIGDTQSIEDDLSTYSSHLTSMKHFVNHANKKTLFLIDEFGKGTEPQFGGAIAESVLRQLNDKRSYGVITTHYQNLKNMADEEYGIVNGAMKYDLEKLEPLFELEMGKPGSSFAFEIASKIGLPKAIIKQAKEKVGHSQVDYDQLLNQLEAEKGKLTKLAKQKEADQKELAKSRKEYEDLREMLEEERKIIIKEAKNEAKSIIEGANKDVERVIREIKESKASANKTRELRDVLNTKRKKLEEAERKSRESFRVGDHVKMLDQDSVGVIKKIKGKQAEVLFGSLKSVVSIEKLKKAAATAQQQHQQKVRKLGIDISKKMASFNHELSLRGSRAEEALARIESFIDEAILLGVNEAKIVHGKGHGVLREIVRNYTKDHPGVASVADEHPDRGGSGVSIIKFK